MTKYPRRSPLKAIRVFCVECQGESFQGVAECRNVACPFHEYRHGEALESGQHKPLAATKAYCFENCQAGAERNEVVNCQGDKAVLGPCVAFPFRLGANPNISAETREKYRQNAIKHNPLGLNLSQNFLNQTPIDAPESTETDRAIP